MDKVASWASSLPPTSRLASTVILAGYALQLVAPALRKYLALVPARAVPCVWMLATAGFLETRLIEAVVSAASLAFAGSVLEPLWGSKELALFFVVADVSSSAAGLVTGYVHYATNVYARDAAKILFSEFNGAHGIVAGCLVALKQVMPDQDVGSWGGLSGGGGNFRVKHLLAAYVVATTVLSVFTKTVLSTVPVVLAGAYASWLYLRFVQVKPELNLRGDPSAAFALSNFFPEPLQTTVDALSASVSRAIGAVTGEAGGYDAADGLGAAPSGAPISEQAARRRERGARALEERMGAKASAAAASAAAHQDVEARAGLAND